MSDRRRGLLIGCLSPVWGERPIATGVRFRHGNDRIAVEAIQKRRSIDTVKRSIDVMKRSIDAVKLELRKKIREAPSCDGCLS